MLTGTGGLVHVNELLQYCQRKEFMERLGLDVSGSVTAGSGTDDPRQHEADQLCEKMGALATSLAVRRLRSLADEGGFPRRFVQLLGDDAGTVLKGFKEMVDVYDSIEGYGSKFMMKVRERSPMRLRKVQQLRLLCERSDWQLSESLVEVVRHDFAGITQTKVVEDGFNHARYVESSKNNRRNITSDHAYSAVIRSDVLGGRHRYASVEFEHEILPRGAVQSGRERLYTAETGNTPAEYKSIVSKQAQRNPWCRHVWSGIVFICSCTDSELEAPYYSPSAPMGVAPLEDCALLKFLAGEKKYEDAELSWLCVLASPGRMVMRHPRVHH
eukprot:6491942-Amphidinium_carterae.1